MFLDNLILWLALWIFKKFGAIKFKDWLKLEGLKEKVVKAVEQNSDEFPIHLIDFVSTALHVPARYIQDAEWIYIVYSFYEVLHKCPEIKLPITEPSYEKLPPEEWDYEGRTWHQYAHLLAESYGWTLEYISQLQVVEALAKIQEILAERQLDREFQHSLSELAYVYDKQSKTSHFKPLNRPHWMRPKVKVESIKKIRMPASILPVGNVDYDALPEEFRPQQIIAQ